MSYALFLDDERDPPEKCPDGCEKWMVARSFADAIRMASLLTPSYVSFDHDLGMGGDGMDFARWLVNQDLDGGGRWLPEGFRYYVHSQNPVGRDNIVALLEAYLARRGR
jgi:hypothetical protein